MTPTEARERRRDLEQQQLVDQLLNAIGDQTDVSAVFAALTQVLGYFVALMPLKPEDSDRFVVLLGECISRERDEAAEHIVAMHDDLADGGGGR